MSVREGGPTCNLAEEEQWLAMTEARLRAHAAKGVQGLGSRVSGLGFRVQGLGFRV